MHIPAPPRLPVLLISSTGDTTPYESLGDFIAAVGLAWIRIAIGPRPPYPRVFDQENGFSRPVYPFVLRDAFGDRLTFEDCEALARERRRQAPRHRGRWGQALATWNGKGPVPLTGKRRAGHWFRHPLTTSQLRAAAGVERSEGEPEFRGARRHGYLRDAWDDVRVAARDDRSWKRHRNRQRHDET